MKHQNSEGERSHSHRERHHGREHHGDQHHGHGNHGHQGEGRDQGERQGRGRGGFGGGRVWRGDARYLLMDVLKDGPKQGQEIIKTLEERSSGQYVPSAGRVYPAMQFLEDLSLVRAEQEGDRHVFSLTDTGRAELETHTEEVSAFWARFVTPASSAASQTEVGFLQEELDQLNRTVWNGLRTVQSRNDSETVRRVRTAIENCQIEIRGIIVSAVASPEAPIPNE